MSDDKYKDIRERILESYEAKIKKLESGRIIYQPTLAQEAKRAMRPLLDQQNPPEIRDRAKKIIDFFSRL